MTDDTETRDQAPINPGHPGIAVVLADGREWTLPYSRRWEGLADERETFATAAWTGGKVDGRLIEITAMVLLSRAYQLEPVELARLVADAPDRQALFEAVMDCLVLPPDDDATTFRSYDHWLKSGLIAAGLGAAKIPDEILPSVVKQLVDTGRMVRPEHFISAAIGLRRHQEALEMISGR